MMGRAFGLLVGTGTIGGRGEHHHNGQIGLRFVSPNSWFAGQRSQQRF